MHIKPQTITLLLEKISSKYNNKSFNSHKEITILIIYLLIDM